MGQNSQFGHRQKGLAGGNERCGHQERAEQNGGKATRKSSHRGGQPGAAQQGPVQIEADHGRQGHDDRIHPQHRQPAELEEESL